MSRQSPQVTLTTPSNNHTSILHRNRNPPSQSTTTQTTPSEPAPSATHERVPDRGLPNFTTLPSLATLPNLSTLTLSTVKEERKGDVFGKVVVRLRKVTEWFRIRKGGGKRRRVGERLGWKDLEVGERGGEGDQMEILGGEGGGGFYWRDKPLPALPREEVGGNGIWVGGEFGRDTVEVICHQVARGVVVYDRQYLLDKPLPPLPPPEDDEYGTKVMISRDVVVYSRQYLLEKPLPPLPPPENDEDVKEVVVFKETEVGVIVNGEDTPLPAVRSSTNKVTLLEDRGQSEDLTGRWLVPLESLNKPLPAISASLVEEGDENANVVAGGENAFPVSIMVMRVDGMEMKMDHATVARVWARVDSGVQGLSQDEDVEEGENELKEELMAECGMEVKGWNVF